MRGGWRVLAGPLAAACLAAPWLTGMLAATAPPAAAVTCPTARPTVRVGADAAASSVDLVNRVLTTVGALGAVPRPITATASADTRIGPTETTRYGVTARLVGIRLEPDGDLALSLQGDAGQPMLASIPAPECVPVASPFRTAIVQVRGELEAAYPGLTGSITTDRTVRLDGIGHFDPTGRAGGSPSAVSLHPVLDLQLDAARVAIRRTAGSDRYATAAAVSAEAFPSGATAVFVATGTAFPDALAGSAAAAALGGPVLLTDPATVPTATAAELGRLQPAHIYLLGGTGAVSPAVADQLAAIAPVERIAGATRYETAAAVADRFFEPNPPDAFVATGLGFPDALSGAAAAGILGAPTLLVTASSVPAATGAELTRLHPARITVLGGSGVVGPAVQATLASYAPAVRRVSGIDRYATSAAISATVFPNATKAWLATGTGFADALAGGPVAARPPGGPVLLAQPACVPKAVGAELGRLPLREVTLLGGTGSLTTAVAALTPCEVYSPYVARVPVPVGCHTVGPDSAGVKVYLVQKVLGLTSHRERYDSATVAAVRTFQSSHRLPVTGLVDRTTWDALRTGYDFCIDRYVVQPTVAPLAPTQAHVDAMLAHAQALLGKRYIWGGAGPLGYDCSGLALQSMYAGGRVVPGVTIDLHVTASFATARAIYTSTALPHVPLAQRRPGDLVFWYSDVSHMAVYLGGDRIVEAVRPAVRTASLWVHGTPLPTVVRPFP